MVRYVQYENLFFEEGTNEQVKRVLEDCFKSNTRIVVDYGDILTGNSWNECYNISGTVGRTAGKIKIPILVYNSRSLGGGAISCASIVAIKTSKGKKLLYTHENYKPYGASAVNPIK